MIALICATPWEAASLATRIEDGEERPSPSGMRLVEGAFCGRRVAVLTCGVGKVPASAGTMFLIDHYDLETLVNFGIAGALSPALTAGELVVAEELVHGDVGVAHSRGFGPTGPGLCTQEGFRFVPRCPVPPRLVETAKASAAEAGVPFRSGRLLTCDQMVMDPELRAHLGRAFDALAVEMEGAAAAQVAEGEGVPFLAVRAISDEIDHDFVGLERLLPVRGQTRRNIWGRRFLLAVTNPGFKEQARELSRGRDVALANLAAFLDLFLQRLGGPGR